VKAWRKIAHRRARLFARRHRGASWHKGISAVAHLFNMARIVARAVRARRTSLQ